MTEPTKELREKWEKEAEEKYPDASLDVTATMNVSEEEFSVATMNGLFYVQRSAYLAAREAAHRESSERVATLEGLLREASAFIPEELYANHLTIELSRRITATLSEPKDETPKP